MDRDRRSGFEQLCREEYAAVVRTAFLITGDREEAEDLAQEAFIRAYERWANVAALERPGAWLQRVVANLSLSWRRKLLVRRRSLPSEPVPVAQPHDFDEGLMAALRRLTPAQRAVVVLRYYADQSIDQTAAALGKRPGTVRALTSQALTRLRDQLSQDVSDDARH